jgi:hypothetical protein
MKTDNRLKLIFWIALVLFLIWDWNFFKPINLLSESPAFAIGSGQQSSGGHCSNSSK